MKGNYYKDSEVKKFPLKIIDELFEYLDENYDPGHYDMYKERDQTILPYVDGKPQWVIEYFVPQEIEEKLPKELRRIE